MSPKRLEVVLTRIRVSTVPRCDLLPELLVHVSSHFHQTGLITRSEFHALFQQETIRPQDCDPVQRFAARKRLRTSLGDRHLGAGRRTRVGRLEVALVSARAGWGDHERLDSLNL